MSQRVGRWIRSTPEGMDGMKARAGFFDARRGVCAGSSGIALCFMLSVALFVFGGCVPPRTAANDENCDEFSLRVPHDWNGQVAMLMRDSVAGSGGSAASMLLGHRYAVAARSACTTDSIMRSDSPDGLSIHFALGFGSPTDTYLVGMSQGEHVALATIEKSAGVLDRALVYAPGGFVHVSVLARQDARTIELALRADESMAALLSARLEVDRSDLPDALEFYYALLTGVRNGTDDGSDAFRTVDVGARGRSDGAGIHEGDL